MSLLITLHELQLTHPLLTVVFFHFVLLVSRSPVLAAVLPVAFYWGREMRDSEVALKIPPVEGWKVFLPIGWPLPSHLDFWPVVLVSGVLLVTWRVLLRRSRETEVVPPARGSVSPEPDALDQAAAGGAASSGSTSSKLASRSRAGS